MALTAAMSAAITGLKTHMDALNVVGNNVANVNTYGYKAGRVTFRESIYSTSSAGSAGTTTMGGTNPTQIGYGTSVGTIDLDMSTQTLESTGYGLDVAIQGDGFFLVGPKGLTFKSVDDVSKLYFSKVGDFEFDADGYLTDGAGNVVYGFQTVTDDGDASTNPADTPSTVLVPIRLPYKDATTGDALYPTRGNPGDTANGTIDPDAVSGLVTLENISIDKNGCIKGTNGDTNTEVVVGYLALGTVANPGGLLHTDGPYYTAGEAAGDIRLFAPRSSVTGALNNQDSTNTATDAGDKLLAGSEVSLMPGFLEGSGTDLATEFSNMIIYQRGYQANTRIVTVTDAMLEELVNMKR